MKFLSKACFLLCFVLLAGCPTVTKVQVSNDTNSDIHYIYENGNEFLIRANSSAIEHYSFQCIRIREDQKLYEFTAILPPKGWKLNNRFFVRFGKEKMLFFHKTSSPDSEQIKFEEACNKD